MPKNADYGTLDLHDLSVGAMLRAGLAMSGLVRGSATVQDAADAVTKYFHTACVDPATGAPSVLLSRFYITHRLGELPLASRVFAEGLLSGVAASPEIRCLTLLASAGDEPDWNSPATSRGHRAIPLPTGTIVRAAPMIAGLIQSMGMDIDALVSGAAKSTDARTYEVFHVERAVGSPLIPAQDSFVVPYGVASVVGFGGLLRTGELFAVILFSRVWITRRSAQRFRTIALDIRSALYSLDQDRIFTD